MNIDVRNIVKEDRSTHSQRCPRNFFIDSMNLCICIHKYIHIGTEVDYSVSFVYTYVHHGY